MAKKAKATLAEKVRQYLRAKEAGQRGYKRADRLLGEIAEEIKPGQEIALEGERKAVLKDKFEGKEIVWTPCAARRWELEVLE